MNRNLGNYDMVLALSSSKINYQFKKMYQRKIIHSDWAFLTNSMGKEIKTLTNEEAQNYWKNLDTNKSDLVVKKAEFKSIDNDMMAAIDAEDFTKIKELKSKKQSIQAEVDALQAEVDKANLYDLGLIATIAEPKIEILSETSKELIFQISFKGGSTLFYAREGKKAEYDLGGNGIKYAFRVSIGKIKITSDRKIVEIDENGKEKEKTLRDKGINDNDFTIQALFLDFENANIANYDSKSSTLPESASDNALLQAAMVNYFKSLANSDNPYVLGYGIHKNEVQEGERGLFYPTGVAYSTSHSREQRASTFNFLMLLNNHPFPSGNDSGVLPVSLMEKAQDTTATVNGVFGLNLSEFENNYVPLLSSEISDKFESSPIIFGTKVIDKNIHCQFAYKDYYKDKKTIQNGSLILEYQGIESNEGARGVNLKYKITGLAELHEQDQLTKIKRMWSLSTEGKEAMNKTFFKAPVPPGKAGSLTITLQADSSGRFRLEHHIEAPKFGLTSPNPRFQNPGENIGNFFGDLAKIFSGMITEFLQELYSALNEICSIQYITSLDLTLQEMERRVILPVASVYTYKNVRILGNSSDPNSVLLFDTSYGTVAQ